MRLFHFTSQEYGLLALEKRRLKIARINELNDPFEFLGRNLRDRCVRAKLKDWKRQRDEELGILCLSGKWSNPLLWGHYADKHHGMAIGFDVPECGTYRQVKYCRKRLPVPSDSELEEGDLDDLLLTKFNAWRYESEYRRFCHLADGIRESDLYFEPFSNMLKLAQVIVGERSTISRRTLDEVLGPEYAHVEKFKARPAFGDFSVVRNRNDRLWT